MTASSDAGPVVQSALKGFAVHCEKQREFKRWADSRHETIEECLKARPDWDGHVMTAPEDGGVCARIGLTKTELSAALSPLLRPSSGPKQCGPDQT